MAQLTVKSPVTTFTGATVGVQFVDGVATIDDRKQLAQLEYFNRHGFTVSAGVESTEPKQFNSETAAPAEVAKLTRAQLDELATFHGLTPADFGKKAEIVEAINDAIATKTDSSDKGTGENVTATIDDGTGDRTPATIENADGSAPLVGEDGLPIVGTSDGNTKTGNDDDANSDNANANSGE